MVPVSTIEHDNIGRRLADRHTVGFDYQRLILALLVLLWHSFAVGGDTGSSVAEWYRVSMRAVLPLFFSLSGFLVSSSMDRLQHLPTFLVMRILRILPALVVETLLSAFILGPLLTTLSLGAYFTHPEFRDYLMNVIGWVHFDLPGVFKANPVTWVNRSLWTVPYELECYLAIAGMFAIGAFKRPPVLLALLAAFSALCAYVYRDYSYANAPLVPGRLLIAYFIAGMLVYKLRDRLPGGAILAWVMVLVSIVLLVHEWTTWFSPIPIAYASALLGCTKPWKVPVIFDGDYSYGMYLYAFPIQQTIFLLFGRNQTVLANALIATVVTAAFAAFSWHAIEKPTVNLKQKIRRRQLASAPTWDRISDATSGTTLVPGGR